MYKLLIIFIIIALFKAPGAAASFYFAENSAKIASTSAVVNDTRISKLETYLEKHKSPLADHAAEFIYYADLYQIDWRLLPAISGVESTFGKHIPANSYNAYGWAGGRYRFESWENSIETVTKALREKYYDRGANTVYKIGRIYCPPNPAWPNKVKFFMNKIDDNSIEFSL